MTRPKCDYISAGGNRHPSAADWDKRSRILAFGAAHNVALWIPLGATGRGIYDILTGHADQVNAVKFGPELPDGAWSLLSGSVDGDICIWKSASAGHDVEKWMLLSRLKGHDGAVNAIATVAESQLFVTAGADSTIKIWKLPAGAEEASLFHNISLKPRYIPLTIAVGHLDVQDDEVDAIFIAVGGTTKSVQIYAVADLTAQAPAASIQATLTGHESWITSLALTDGAKNHGRSSNDVWLASASQDKSVRLWRIGRERRNHATGEHEDELSFEPSLSAKVHTIRSGTVTLPITFEALLLGHEDWIYTALWNGKTGSQRLLTASADNSLIIWESDASSGVWVSDTRLGEISGQKGSTSATGTTGGFWMGLWSPEGNAVACLGKSGSWRLWQHDQDCSYWIPRLGLSGHTAAVTDVSWTKYGEYMLTTSSDQTTRLHSEWSSGSSTSWHEFARPQIHGYDLNCVQSLSTTRFVSGADEKLLRVFDLPKNVAQMLEKLSKIESSEAAAALPDAASVPALGLSNKTTLEPQHDSADGVDDIVEGGSIDKYESEEPPTEDYLSRHTLWPEVEKLYGHGHEISAVAANFSGSMIATACKASSTEHAVIRLYDANDWHEIRPPLAAHSLTIARMQFHMNTNDLVSVGRDRQWALFRPREDGMASEPSERALQDYVFVASNPKGHSRMILDVAWSSIGDVPFFATAGRDKTAKIWATKVGEEPNSYVCRTVITRTAPVTAVDWYCNWDEDLVCLAVGEENGKISYHVLPADGYGSGQGEVVEPLESVELEAALCPSQAITRLAWRPNSAGRNGKGRGDQLAVASADSSLRIFTINWEGGNTIKMQTG